MRAVRGGIKLMINEYRRVGIPDPEFHADGGFVWVVFHYTRVVVGQVPTKYRPSTDLVLMLAKVLADRELSVKDLMEVPLYPNQPNHPKQKYRLTDKGKELLKQ